MSNPSGINPKGYRILLRPKEVARQSAGGIILNTEAQSEREQMANTIGIVVDMGDNCFIEQPTPWCKIGDKVAFAKYAGLLYTGKDGINYRMINDGDITATLDDDVVLVDPYLSKGAA